MRSAIPSYEATIVHRPQMTSAKFNQLAEVCKKQSSLANDDRKDIHLPLTLR